jgi:hypothetical protein
VEDAAGMTSCISGPVIFPHTFKEGVILQAAEADAKTYLLAASSYPRYYNLMCPAITVTGFS